ncbi:MAG: 5'-nucleotidase C-terminal domain-containing protein [Bacilli bacterium]|nr:5'-nucleotidase C-terminal domain-containing protein [Bacilli bacterium]
MKKKAFTLVALSFLLSGCRLVSNNSQSTNPDKYLFVNNKPTTLSYHVGDALNLAGISILQVDGDHSSIIEDYVTNPKEGYIFLESDAGNKSISVDKTGYKSANFTVTVSNLPKLEIRNLPYKTEYEVGELFSSNGLSIYYGNKAFTKYNLSLEGKVFNQVGTFTCVVAIEGYYPVSFDVKVFNSKQLIIDSLPNKTTYTQGEEFDIAGLVVKDGKGNIVSDYSLSKENGDKFKYEGETTIIVSKTGYIDASFKVTVNKGAPIEDKNASVRIYYINDTHGSFVRTDNEAGMAYIGQYIMSSVANDMANGKYSIVLSGGDMFQGGFESNETYGDIMIDAMNIIGFDAMVLGNHEFDWGEECIPNFASKLNCPIISSNVFFADSGERPNYISPYVILERGDVKIGIIGAARENMGSSITGSISDKFRFPSPNSYIKSFSNELRKTYNCDLIIAAFHDEGFEDTSGSPVKYSDLTEVDAETGRKYVDAMFFAHDHKTKSGELNDVPYLEAGSNGKYLGIMEFDLHSDGYGYTASPKTRLYMHAPTYCTEENPEIAALADKYESVYGDPDEIVYTFKNYYSSDSFTSVVCQAMLWYVNNHQSEFDYTPVYFASHNTGGIRTNIQKGVFTKRDLIKAFPFDNALTIQTCNSTNIENMKNSSYYATAQTNDFAYDGNGLVKAVSIVYISEYRYASYYQQSYIKYNVTAKEALYTYLVNQIDPNL